MAKITYYTKEGLKKLKEDLNLLVTVERPAISRQIAEARDKGDLSENAEYHAAKEAQGMLEMKISKLQDLLSNARIIDDNKKPDISVVSLLSNVTIKNLKNNAVVTYQIVPELEADFKAGKISVSSPMSKGMLGRKAGDLVDILVPAGTMKIEIMEVF